ncbi:virion structural protein [Erythrobacter phage vB_EliS_R6L]|nr:virion structural protein [Erythrobacter phage vB_EliS_R6L]
MSEIDLYRIVVDEQVWTLTSADKRQAHNAEIYLPVPMGRTGTEQKNSLARANLDIRIPITHRLAEALMTTLYDQVVTLTLFVNDDGDISTQWKGRLATVEPEKANLKLSFDSIFTSLRRPGLRARFQRSCRHALYFRGCNLDKDDFATAATLSAIAGTTLTVPAAAGQADGYFLGGMVAAANGALAYVTGHVGDQITVQRMPYPLIKQFEQDGVGTAITLYPGCDHRRATCKAKFDNLLNYGGFDWIPQKNPMGGSSIV